MTSKAWLFGGALLVLTVFLVSLGLPAVYQHGFGAPTSGLPGSVLPGYALLLGFPYCLLSFGWWANPALAVSLVCLLLGRRRTAWLAALLGLVCAALVRVFGPFPPDPFEPSHFHAGYFVWLGSMAALFVLTSIAGVVGRGTSPPIADSPTQAK